MYIIYYNFYSIFAFYTKQVKTRVQIAFISNKQHRFVHKVVHTDISRMLYKIKHTALHYKNPRKLFYD